MTRHPAFVVVAAWGLFNGVLLAVLAMYGESSLVYWLWGGVVALLELAALAVLLSSSAGPEQHVGYRLPGRGGVAVLPAAVGLAVLGLGFVYGWWLLAVAVPLLCCALLLGAVQGRGAGDE